MKPGIQRKSSVGDFLDSCTYEDEFVKVKRGQVTITWYYFPTSASKKIPTDNIIGVYYEVQDLRKQLFKVKGWGMSLTPCWWACDVFRNWKSSSEKDHYNVAIDNGETTYKGFTVCDIHAFLRALRPQLRYDFILQNALPF